MDNQVDINTIREWEHNPRTIDATSYDRLKKQIEMLGQYKPLLITNDNIIIGGNMRIKALRELGYTTVWVSRIQFNQKEDGLFYPVVNGTEAQKRFNSIQDGMMEYAMSDNDEAGYTDLEKIANIAPQFNVDWDDYASNFESLVTIKNKINAIAPAVDSNIGYQIIISANDQLDAERIYNQMQQDGYKAKIKASAKRIK